MCELSRYRFASNEMIEVCTMDQNYVKFGIVDVKGQLTEFGHIYGMYLIINIGKVNRRDNISVDCYAWVSACHIPENVLNRNYGIDEGPLTSTGIRWLNSYIKTHEFNPYIYSLVKGISVYDMIIPA